MTATATPLVESMVSAWNAGDAERVLALAVRADAADRTNAGFLALLGLAQQQTGDYARAAQTFERLTCLQPTVSAWWNNLGVALRHAGDLDASGRALSRAKTLAP